jgi:exopolyphosphatase/guanosine-5'-triphosphate,3'-diphosphate pyrophosphatase
MSARTGIGEETAPVVAIDCGTNSIRLLIADVKDGVVRELEPRLTRINRLGFGVDKTRRFDADALVRTYEFEREYQALIEKHNIPAENIKFIATSASRDAENRDDFFKTTRDILGVTPEVISGDLEAKLSFSGVVSRRKNEKMKLVVDLGGGSTELIVGVDFPQAMHSMNIGSVRITERYFSSSTDSDAVLNDEEIQEAKRYCTETISDTLKLLEAQGAEIRDIEEVIGVAGTITTICGKYLGLSQYDRDAINSSIIPVRDAIETAESFLRMSKPELRALGFLHPGRVDVIRAGCLIFVALLERLMELAPKLKYVVVSENDILDGIALSFDQEK